MTKPTKWHVRPAKTQISLGISPVWSVFTVRMKKAWVLSYTLSAQRRLWSDWADAQADLSLRWAHMQFCRFCHALAHIHRFHWFCKWSMKGLIRLTVPEKRSTQEVIILISPQKHLLTREAYVVNVLLMSTYNICFHEKIRKISIFLGLKQHFIWR